MSHNTPPISHSKHHNLQVRQTTLPRRRRGVVSQWYTTNDWQGHIAREYLLIDEGFLVTDSTSNRNYDNRG